MFTPFRCTTFIGIDQDSVTLRACLSQERVDSFLRCLAMFRLGRAVQYRTCMRVAELMA